MLPRSRPYSCSSQLFRWVALAACAAGCENPQRAITAFPTSTPATQSNPSAAPVSLGTVGQFFLASDGVTDGDQPPFDLLVHFHGDPAVVKREALAAGIRAAVVVVNYRGMSSAYEKPFSDPSLFSAVLEEAWTARRRAAGLADIGTGSAAWGRICVSSFSAGYGAIRALLCQPSNLARIDAIYLADSLYAGWTGDGDERCVDARNMEPFRRFASSAAAGQSAMIVTHGCYDPVRYAGTHITADDLIAHVGATRRTVDEPGPARLRVESRVDVGELHIFGCAGDTGEDHGEHLRGLRFGFARLPLERASK